MQTREKNNESNTIVALATPPGRGALGIVRVSGVKTVDLARKILKQVPKPRYATLLPFYNQKQQVIDQGIALFFNKPHSFTGEDVLELHAHGGALVIDQLLEAMIGHGARLAEPGEFSKRAFLNGKLDLAQAEAISDLINAQSRQAARSALRSLQGDFSCKISTLLEQLIVLRVRVEAAIDFSEEDIDFSSSHQIIEQGKRLLVQLGDIFNTAKQGALLQEGLTIVMVGPPNVGKSSLMNRLSQQQTAIVSDIAGTTRDVLRQSVELDGLMLHLVDTAGLRHSDNMIEQEGVKRARVEITRADLVILMLDALAIQSDLNLVARGIESIASVRGDIPLLLIENKVDLLKEKAEKISREGYTSIRLSVKKDQGIEQLLTYIKQFAGFVPHEEGQFIARRRHIDALSRTHEAIGRGLAEFQASHALELLAEDLNSAQQALSEITGDYYSDDLLGAIFSEFCIGK